VQPHQNRPANQFRCQQWSARGDRLHFFARAIVNHSIRLYWKSILDGVGNGFVEDESYRDGKRNIHHDGLNVKIKADPVFVSKLSRKYSVNSAT